MITGRGNVKYSAPCQLSNTYPTQNTLELSLDFVVISLRYVMDYLGIKA